MSKIVELRARVRLRSFPGAFTRFGLGANTERGDIKPPDKPGLDIGTSVRDQHPAIAASYYFPGADEQVATQGQ